MSIVTLSSKMGCEASINTYLKAKGFDGGKEEFCILNPETIGLCRLCPPTEIVTDEKGRTYRRQLMFQFEQSTDLSVPQRMIEMLGVQPQVSK